MSQVSEAVQSQPIIVVADGVFVVLIYEPQVVLENLKAQVHLVEAVILLAMFQNPGLVKIPQALLRLQICGVIANPREVRSH